MDFKSRLISLRKSRGLTQERLASDLDIPTTTVRRWESVGIPPKRERLEMLADYFRVSVDYLLGRTDDPTPPGEKSIDITVIREAAEAYVSNKSHADARLNDAETTIKLIEEEARKLGMSPTDAEFQKLLSHAFDLLRMARGQNDK